MLIHPLENGDELKVRLGEHEVIFVLEIIGENQVFVSAEVPSGAQVSSTHGSVMAKRNETLKGKGILGWMSKKYVDLVVSKTSRSTDAWPIEARGFRRPTSR